MTRVVFLRTKRYPHPSGPKRLRGTVMPIEDDVAAAWAKAGLVELLDALPAEPEVAPPALSTLTVPQLRELAEQHGVDLQGATRKAEIVAALEAAESAAPADAASDEHDGASLTD